MIDESHADGSIKCEIRRIPRGSCRPTRVSPVPRRAPRRRQEGLPPHELRALLHGGTALFPAGGTGAAPLADILRSRDRGSAQARLLPPADRNGASLMENGPGAPVYSGGDVWGLEKMLGFAGDAILYWGDHTYGDILRSKKSVGWRTAMIIPELENEIAITEKITPQLARARRGHRGSRSLDLEEQMARTELDRLTTLLHRTPGSAAEARHEIVRKVHGIQSGSTPEQEKVRLHENRGRSTKSRAGPTIAPGVRSSAKATRSRDSATRSRTSRASTPAASRTS